MVKAFDTSWGVLKNDIPAVNPNALLQEHGEMLYQMKEQRYELEQELRELEEVIIRVQKDIDSILASMQYQFGYNQVEQG